MSSTPAHTVPVPRSCSTVNTKVYCQDLGIHARDGVETRPAIPRAVAAYMINVILSQAEKVDGYPTILVNPLEGTRNEVLVELPEMVDIKMISEGTERIQAEPHNFFNKQDLVDEVNAACRETLSVRILCSPNVWNVIEIVDVRREPLDAITQEECAREGYPDLTPEQFIRQYGRKKKTLSPDHMVTRIEFRHIEKGEEPNVEDKT